MVTLHVKQKYSLKTKQVQRLMAKIKLANLMNLPEDKYRLLVKEIEANPLFKKLMYSDNKKERVLGYRRFPDNSVSSGFYGLREEITADKKVAGIDSLDMDSLLNGKRRIIRLIRSIGEEGFKKHFLYNDENLSHREIADKCGIEKSEAEQIIDLLNTIDVYNSFSNPSSLNLDYQKHYIKVASIKRVLDKGGNTGNFTIEFSSINFTRGKYVIDYDRISMLKNENYFSKKELKELNKLIGTMELINTKKATIYRIIEKIIKKQNRYLESENTRDLVPFTEKQMAEELELDCSIISRAISSRSIEIPRGAEKSLKDFLPSKKKARKELIYEIISREDAPQTDNEIRDRLRDEYGINISRRSVASCRLEMELPSNYGRRSKK